MRTVARRALEGAAGRLARLARAIHETPQERRVEPWFRDRGDRTLRLDYALDADSLVLDLGGYEGQWTSDLFARFCCSIWVFEAAPEFARAIERRFARNSKIRVFPFGLGDRTGTVTLSVDGDATSTFPAEVPRRPEVCSGADTGPNGVRSPRSSDAGHLRPVEARIVSASEFLTDQKVGRIDLMKVNIEGGEYALIEHMIESGWIARVVDLQVQFHDFVPGARERMRAIQRHLAATHEPTWQYEFVWENWRRRSET